MLYLSEMVSMAFDITQTCLVRAWDPAKPLLYCPAMNTMMWEHPHTAQHRERLCELSYIEVAPVAKMLACGDEGTCIIMSDLHGLL